MNIQKIHKLFLINNSVSIDTRNIKENDIFKRLKVIILMEINLH